MTPRQYFMLLDRHTERIRHEEWMAGMMCCTIANFGPYPPKQPLKPSDFFPMRPAGKKQRENRKASTERLRNFFQSTEWEGKPIIPRDHSNG